MSDMHDCPVTNCGTQVAYSQLMCKRHWRMVPRELQRNVYATWRSGAGAGTQAHLDAMDAAIAAAEERSAA